MKIADILAREQVVSELTATDKDGVLRELVRHLCDQKTSLPASYEQIVRALVDRERLGSTGVGEGVAIPHAKVAGLTELVACFGRAKGGVPFDAIDRQPVTLIFALLVPENSAGAHLKALARISRLLKNEEFRTRLNAIGDANAIYQAFVDEDERY